MLIFGPRTTNSVYVPVCFMVSCDVYCILLASAVRCCVYIVCCTTGIYLACIYVILLNPDCCCRCCCFVLRHTAVAPAAASCLLLLFVIECRIEKVVCLCIESDPIVSFSSFQQDCIFNLPLGNAVALAASIYLYYYSISSVSTGVRGAKVDVSPPRRSPPRNI